jgi:hypothetical protein
MYVASWQAVVQKKKLCVKQYLRYGDCGSLRVLKIESSNFLMAN